MRRWAGETARDWDYIRGIIEFGAPFGAIPEVGRSMVLALDISRKFCLCCISWL